jgi:DNA-binding winged helix-turn-helix (wHTH) protein/tetratricopeptide (TPR) repeat protein
MLAGARSGASDQSARLIGSPIVLAHESPFRIGRAEFSPATRELTFDGRRSVVEPRVMQLLVALYRAGGAVVAKDDLAILCWEGRIVGEDAINRVLSRLRAVARKQAGGEFRVETITRVGYRLIARDEGSGARTTGISAKIAGEVHPSRRELVIGGAALASVAAAGIGWSLGRRDRIPDEARMLVDDARKSLRQGSLDTAANAIGTLRRATQLAPDSAEAWGLLAFAYMVEATAESLRDAMILQSRGIAAIKRAFALEPFQADALAARLFTIPKYRNWLAFEKESRAALHYHPHHPELMIHLAAVLNQVGRCREALAICDAVLPQIPLSSIVLTARPILLWNLGRLEEADSAVAQASELLPRNLDIWTTGIFYLTYNGRAAEAATILADRAGRPLGVDDMDVELIGLELKALKSGDRALVRKAIDTAHKFAVSGKGFVVYGAVFAAFAGDLDEAFGLLNALFFNRGFKIPEIYFSRANGPYVGHEPYTSFLFARAMSSFRRDPRFAAMTRELGLDDYWTRTKSRSLVLT